MSLEPVVTGEIVDEWQLEEVPAIPAPRGLSAKGKSLWRDMQTRAFWSPAELALLEEACRVRSAIQALDERIADPDHSYLMPGSHGGVIVSPLVVEARMQRATLDKLLARLKVPEDDPEAYGGNAGRGGRPTRQQEWQRSRGGR